jgi:hypothetical protein
MRPPALDRPPGIDPRDHAVESHSWGEEFVCYLVSYEGRWYTWTVRPWDDGDQVYEMPGEESAREFLAFEQARLLSATSWGERVATVSVGDQSTDRVVFSADVLDGAEDGIWLATSEPDGEEDSYALAGFDDLGHAVEAFAARTEQAAGKIERLDIGWPEIAAVYLRYVAASVRAGAARAVLGDALRRRRGRIRAERAVSRVAATVGISREFLYRVLAGDEWTWKALMPVRKSMLTARPTPRLDPAAPETGWSVWARLAIEASDESEARAIGDSVLGKMGVVLVGEPSLVPSGEGFWTITADIDLSGLTEIDPDNAHTRLCYVTGHLGGNVTWGSRVSERQGKFEWPPDFWSRQSGRDDMLAHPAIRAAIIWASAEEGR